MPVCKSCGVDKPRKDFSQKQVRCNPCRSAKNRHSHRARHLKNTYGITPEDYDEMAKDGCNLCGKKRESNGRNLAVDHDHETGKLRGILCVMCNVGLGNLGDNVEGLTRALEYLNASN